MSLARIEPEGLRVKHGPLKSVRFVEALMHVLVVLPSLSQPTRGGAQHFSKSIGAASAAQYAC